MYDSSYGKLRTCAYLPIALTEYDSSGRVIPYNVDDGFESDWVKKVLYDGELSNEDSPEYKKAGNHDMALQNHPQQPQLMSYPP